MSSYQFYLFLFIILTGCKNPEEKITAPVTEEVVQVHVPSERRFTAPDLDYDEEIWTEITENELFSLDIRYATTANFMKQKVYDCGRCFLENETYNAFIDASKELKSKGYKIILYDCYRPKPYQQRLWNIMPDARYVTPPKKGSMHSRGRAIDMGLLYEDNSVVDMGTDYDFFGQEAHYAYPKHSDEIKANRKLLRETMMKFDFKAIRTEWWHFSYKHSKSSFSEWVWPCD